MIYRPLGSTGLSVSIISFGAGPVSGLFSSTDKGAQQSAITRAIESGVNWFDTAATYDGGQSEIGLGEVLTSVTAHHQIHVATKVRVQLTNQSDLRPLVIASVKGSLVRLKRDRVTLLQIHNSITRNRNDQPTSITPEDVLGPKGILAGMEEARDAGWVDHLGLTGIGDAESLKTVVYSCRFATIQAPFHFLNPSAFFPTPAELCDPDYGGFLQSAHACGMGIFAIRVFAAGALLGNEPSAHTVKTPFFPVPLYERDRTRAQRLVETLGSATSLRETALRYVLSQSAIDSAIIGFGQPEQIDEAVRIAGLPRLSAAELNQLEQTRNRTLASR